jgi:hypothetical protein
LNRVIEAKAFKPSVPSAAFASSVSVAPGDSTTYWE